MTKGVVANKLQNYYYYSCKSRTSKSSKLCYNYMAVKNLESNNLAKKKKKDYTLLKFCVQSLTYIYIYEKVCTS